MTTRFCPDCGAEYLADVDECADCLVPLVGGGVSTDNDGGDEVVYELDDWEPELLEQLTDALARNAIPFSWEENRNLVVRERDSDRVEDLLDEIEYPDELDESEDGEEAPADEVPYERMSDLYVAADRLMNAPDDVAVAGELELAALAVEGGQAPFGVAPEEWARITELAAGLRADLAGGADADVVALDARTLRDVLRRFV